MLKARPTRQPVVPFPTRIPKPQTQSGTLPRDSAELGHKGRGKFTR